MGLKTASRSGWLEVGFYYWNLDDSSAEPLIEVSYEVWNGVTLIQAGTTDQNGKFLVSCDLGPYVIIGWARVPGKANVQDFHNNIWQFVNYSTSSTPCSPSPLLSLLTTLADQGMVMTQVRISVDSSRAFFEISRGEVTVEFNRDQGDTHGDYYDSGDDHINLYYNGIYHEYGRFAISHEYGHALAQSNLSESPRDCRRLQSLRGWSHATSLTVFPRSA